MASPHEGTERPTRHRVRMAREQGQVAHSRALTSAVALLGLALVIELGAPRAWGRLVTFTRALWAPASLAGARRPWTEACGAAGSMVLELLAWSCGAIAAAALLAGLLQTRGHLRLQAIGPDLGRVLAGPPARRGSGRALARGAIGALAVGLVIASSWRELLSASARLGLLSPRGVLVAAIDLTRGIAARVLLAGLGVGVCDWLLARRQLRRSLMMTKEEVRRELRELEGDVPRRRERWRRAAASSSMTPPNDGAALAEAVLIVGYSAEGGVCAVALRRGTRSTDIGSAPAPIVAAKASGPAATRLTQQALALGWPVHEDLALARALAFVPSGAPIPQPLSAAVGKLVDGSWRAGSDPTAHQS